MARLFRIPPRALVLTIAAVATGAVFQIGPAVSAAGGPFLSHQALYELNLVKSRGSNAISGARGRILYNFSGSACEGYTSEFRQESELNSGEGKLTLSDLRSSSWEEGGGGRYRFTISNYKDQEQTDATVGNAARTSEKPDAAKPEVDVELTKPKSAKMKLPGKVVFPVQHSIMLIDAAEANRTVLEADLYDGSEKGEKVYVTTAVIGKSVKAAPISIAAKVKNAEKLAGLPSWPVAISYFDQGKEKEDALPVYEIAFRYYANGVSENLTIDYGEFSIKGALKEIEFYDPPKCEPEKK